MRLYLSSYQIGGGAADLVRLLGNNRHVALIGNAMDPFGDGPNRMARLERQSENLAALGCSVDEVDLRHFFGKPNELRQQLKSFGLIWVHGRNSFVLKRAFEQSGCDQILEDLLRRDEIVYGGFSAALMMVMPALRGIELCDDPNTVPPGYEPEFSWEGLGLIGYSIIPHYKSNHPESGMMEDVVNYMQEHGLPYRTLRDGEAVLIDGENEQVVGIPIDYWPGQDMTVQKS